MSDFEVLFEWEDGAGVRGPELAATWARLTILLQGVPVTELEDIRAKSLRTSLSVPLYPIAEWLASNWWWLWYEDRAHAEGYSHERHSLLKAREGFPLPALTLWPQDTRMRVVCEATPHPPSRTRFLRSINLSLPKIDVADVLADFVDAVVQRLEDQRIEATFLQREWQRVRGSENNQEERKFCEHAARLGLDPYALDPGIASRVDGLLRDLPASIRQDFFDSADPARFQQQSLPLFRFLQQAAGQSGGDQDWSDLRRSTKLDLTNLPPWEQGYRFANHLREKLDLNGWLFEGSEQDLLQQLRLNLPLHQWETPQLDAVAGFSADKIPAFALRGNRPESRKFALCRALGETLLQPDDAPVILTRTYYSERQKRSRAFAAEFLAPHAAIRNRLGSRRRTVTETDCEELADVFGVSSWVIQHQIANHQIAQFVSIDADCSR